MNPRRLRLLALALPAVMLVACGGGGGSSASTSTTRRPTTTTEAPSSTSSTASTLAGNALATPVRVQLIGDSITQGEDYYRPVLRQLLADAGCEVSFVGTKPETLASGLEADHSGYGGWTADQIADAVEEWTTQARPQVVTLQAGTNDFYRGHDVATTVEDMRRIITTIRKVNPDVRIVLNTTIPGVGIEDQTSELNTGLLRVVDELQQPASPIVVVDQAFGFDWKTDTHDEVHPTPAASERMAERLLDGLKPVLGGACKSA